MKTWNALLTMGLVTIIILHIDIWQFVKPPAIILA